MPSEWELNQTIRELKAKIAAGTSTEEDRVRCHDLSVERARLRPPPHKPLPWFKKKRK